MCFHNFKTDIFYQNEKQPKEKVLKTSNINNKSLKVS